MESLRKMTQATARLQKPVLVLNASYEPINICAARRALVLVLKGIASAEEVSSHSIPFDARALRVPGVIRDCWNTGAYRTRRVLFRGRIL